jgi:protein phosphatase
VLAQAVGLDVDVEVDTPTLDLKVGDRILFCSDGLTDPVPDPNLTRLLGTFDTPQEAVDGLIKAALNGGGPDNVTLIVIDVS